MYRVATGQGNWKKLGNLSSQGKVRGKYFFEKVGENATRCQIFRLKCIRFDFRRGSTPDPAGGACSAPPDPLAVLNIAP